MLKTTKIRVSDTAVSGCSNAVNKDLPSPSLSSSFPCPGLNLRRALSTWWQDSPQHASISFEQLRLNPSEARAGTSESGTLFCIKTPKWWPRELLCLVCTVFSFTNLFHIQIFTFIYFAQCLKKFFLYF